MRLRSAAASAPAFHVGDSPLQHFVTLLHRLSSLSLNAASALWGWGGGSLAALPSPGLRKLPTHPADHCFSSASIFQHISNKHAKYFQSNDANITTRNKTSSQAFRSI